MPKLKTHKGAQKRFSISGTGKILRSRGPKSHLRRNKSKTMKRLLASKAPLFKGDKKRIRRLIPNGV
jgi:large subunit ribosomal protein L35